MLILRGLELRTSPDRLTFNQFEFGVRDCFDPAAFRPCQLCHVDTGNAASRRASIGRGVGRRWDRTLFWPKFVYPVCVSSFFYFSAAAEFLPCVFFSLLWRYRDVMLGNGLIRPRSKGIAALEACHFNRTWECHIDR